ncbi:hypothetical protein Cni_G25238 [Canna indica]|uniref:RING-type domain-containing protein n=1 Tax=Canna indica TaxID=4628 RepID=A0AAQ3L1J6_9LILI|nr:hypothetical protein Cni_G25238 [Canna indica]
MSLGEAGTDTKEGEEVVHVACSICLDAVKSDGDRSTARLQCGHEFHLDCIGSAFNVKGSMQCPNCRKVEEGNWLYANGSRPTPEPTVDEWTQDEDLYNLNHSETPFECFWCPFGSLARMPSLFEEGESSPAVAFRDFLGHSAIFTENQATLPAANPCPFMAYTPVLQPLSSNSHSFEAHIDVPGYHHQWSHFPRPRDIRAPQMMAPSNLHYRGWEHHPSYSLRDAYIGSADPASHFLMLDIDGLPTADSVFHPFVLSHGTGPRAGATSSSIPTMVPPYHRSHGIIHEHYQLQNSQSAHRTSMPPHGSLRGFDPTDQCGPFLISPPVALGQTNADIENVRNNHIYSRERECFAPQLFSLIDRGSSCWGPNVQASSASDSNTSMAFFPLNISERSATQAAYNRSVPPARSLM